jgi:hypothetical protein
VTKIIRNTVSLARYLRIDHASSRISSLEEARRFYVDYHVMLCEAGIYSCAGILASGKLAFADGPGASGTGTLSELDIGPVLDLRPQLLFGLIRVRDRLPLALLLASTIFAPRRFFGALFDAYVRVIVSAIRTTGVTTVFSANERSIGCAPAVAAAKFRAGCRVIIVQHGNPVADYLPTLADEYWCRSDRWHDHLLRSGIVATLRRIDDFRPLSGIHHDATSHAVLLVLHSMVHLEPEIDYEKLVADIRERCQRAGRLLQVMPHPANNRTFGLPVVDRRAPVSASIAIGFRSTATDQLPADMPRISLLDYWPDFFLNQGQEGHLKDFLRRIDEALR